MGFQASATSVTIRARLTKLGREEIFRVHTKPLKMDKKYTLCISFLSWERSPQKRRNGLFFIVLFDFIFPML